MTLAKTKGSGPNAPPKAALDKLVLATVNAPYRREISASALHECLESGEPGDWLVHVATFFTDLSPDAVFGFAAAHGISKAQLARAYVAMRAASGESNPNLEAGLVPLASVAQ